jgi:CRP/FNR family transcriptional regulator, anaerobic regulatory protein
MLSSAAETVRPVQRGAAETCSSTTSPWDNCTSRRSDLCAAILGDGLSDPPSGRRHRAKPARYIIESGGEASAGVLVICEGWAAKFAPLPRGKRQILSLALPGDLVSAASPFRSIAPYSVEAVTAVRYCFYDMEEVRNRIEADLATMRMWTWLMVAEQDDADKLLVDLGQRSALERVASLILRLVERFESRESAILQQIPLPLRQQHIADLSGLTPVHVCRVLTMLRQEGVCDVAHGVAKVLDRAELERLAASK